MKTNQKSNFFFFINLKLKGNKTQNLSRTRRTLNINQKTQIQFQTRFQKIKDTATCKIILQAKFLSWIITTNNQSSRLFDFVGKKQMKN